MPPKKASQAKGKRPLEEADDNQREPRRSKRVSTGKQAEEAQQPTEEPGESSSTANRASEGPRTRRIRRGPNGEAFVPEVMPKECADVIRKIPMPPRWIAGIDATPKRSMTLTSREWWEEHGPWLEKHKKQLKLSAADWKKREEAMKKDATVPEDEGNDDWDFVCRVKPSGDGGDDEDEEDEEEEEEEEEGEGQGEKDADKVDADKGRSLHGKLASLHPDYPWIFTMRGLDRSQWWAQEVLKRDQDDFSMHIYNDFTSYGVLEVVENIFQQFSDVKKPKASYHDIWPEVEGLALALRTNLIDFGMCDDSERCQRVTEMMGYLALSAIDTLKKQNVFGPNSDVRNIGLVLSMMIRWAWEQMTDYDYDEEKCSWIYKLIDLAEGANINLAVPADFAGELLLIKAARANKAKGMTKWDSVNWTNKVKAYVGRHGGMAGPRSKPKMGGDRFDITKMSTAERKKHSYG
ncbi:hypothetical protein ACJZ2D_011250 [Fusarium nematophilum]